MLGPLGNDKKPIASFFQVRHHLFGLEGLKLELS